MGNVAASLNRPSAKTEDEWAKKLEHIDLSDLKQIKTFSCGVSANVSLVQLKGHQDKSFALKTVPKAYVREPLGDLPRVWCEKKILDEVRSDFIVRLYRSFQDAKCLYLLTEYLPGGELFNLVPVTERAAKFYVGCVVEALDRLHSRNIGHNDLKPENVVIAADGYAKLIDFGAAERLERGQRAHTLCGTYAYLPPEVARSVVDGSTSCPGRDRAVDLWGLGVFAYEIVSGWNPFDDNGNADYKRISSNIVDKGMRTAKFSRRYFSEDCVDFVRELCADVPHARLGYNKIDDIRKHRWFKDFNWTGLRNKSLTPPFVPKVRSAVDTRNFKAEVANFNEEMENEELPDWDI